MKAIEEVVQLLKNEPSNSPSLSQPVIPALQEELAILVSTGKSKEAIGMQPTQEGLKRLTPKDVEKYHKRYEAYVGAKTTETFVDSCISVYIRVVGTFLTIKDVEALQNDLKKDCIIIKESSTLVGSLPLKFGRLLMVANTVLIIMKHINFSAEHLSVEAEHPAEHAENPAKHAEHPAEHAAVDTEH